MSESSDYGKIGTSNGGGVATPGGVATRPKLSAVASIGLRDLMELGQNACFAR